MGTKYSSVSISGYNSSPPADDGTVADSNKLQWQKHLDKIGGPIKTAFESANTALVTALDQSSTSTTATATVGASHHNQIREIASTVSTAITITLSDAATMAAGYVVNIHNLSAVQHTLARATAGDTINGTATDVPIAPYSQIKAWVNASANGYLVSQQDTLGLAGVLNGGAALPQNSQGSAYTLVASDANKHIYMSAAITCTIPANASVAYALGTTLTFVNDAGANSFITIASDTLTLAGTASTGIRTLADNGIAQALKVTATSWFIAGNGLS